MKMVKCLACYRYRILDIGILKAVNEGIVDLEKSRFEYLFKIQKDNKWVEKVSIHLSNPKC